MRSVGPVSVSERHANRAASVVSATSMLPKLTSPQICTVLYQRRSQTNGCKGIERSLYNRIRLCLVQYLCTAGGLPVRFECASVLRRPRGKPPASSGMRLSFNVDVPKRSGRPCSVVVIFPLRAFPRAKAGLLSCLPGPRRQWTRPGPSPRNFIGGVIHLASGRECSAFAYCFAQRK